MPSVLSLLLAEARKQARLKLPYVGLIAVVIMAAMWPHLMSYYSDLPSTLPQTGYEFVANAMISINTLLIPIFVAIFAATLVAGETSRGTIRYVLCRPVTRVAFLLSKFAAGFIYVALMMLTAAVVVAIVGAVAIGYGTERDQLLGVMLSPLQFWPEFALGACLALAPAFATAAYGVCLSVLFRSTGAAVGVAAGALVALEPFKHILVWDDVNLKQWLWTEYYDKALSLVSLLAQGTPDLWNTPQIRLAVIVPTIWIAFFGAIALTVMLRRDWGQ